MDRRDIIKVTWVDPHSMDIWVEVDEPELFLTRMVISVGLLIKETDDYILIALSYDEFGNKISNALHIPIRCIDSVEIL